MFSSYEESNKTKPESSMESLTPTRISSFPYPLLPPDQSRTSRNVRRHPCKNGGSNQRNSDFSRPYFLPSAFLSSFLHMGSYLKTSALLQENLIPMANPTSATITIEEIDRSPQQLVLSDPSVEIMPSHPLDLPNLGPLQTQPNPTQAHNPNQRKGPRGGT